jgi:hypothetical protein
MNTEQQEKVDALLRRGFCYLTTEELELASHFVYKANSPRFNELQALLGANFDGFGEALLSGLAGWGGNSVAPGAPGHDTPRGEIDLAASFPGYPNEVRRLSILQVNVKERVNRFFANKIVNFEKLTDRATRALESNGWKPACENYSFYWAEGMARIEREGRNREAKATRTKELHAGRNPPGTIVKLTEEFCNRDRTGFGDRYRGKRFMVMGPVNWYHLNRLYCREKDSWEQSVHTGGFSLEAL